VTAASTSNLAPRVASGLRLQLYIANVMIVVEIALGVDVNLFAKLPLSDKGASGLAALGAAIGSGPLSLGLHAIVGTLIVLASISVIIRAVSTRHPVFIALAVVGLLGVLMAWGSGTSFIGAQTDGSSFAMTIGTSVALLSYLTALFMLRVPATNAIPGE
jgi:hypothetical protein